MAIHFKKSPAQLNWELAETEWNLAAELKAVPEWQWLTMLNYEYARCCKSLIQAVALLRKEKQDRKPNEKVPLQFARFLAKHFPEFPETSWAQIAEKNRAERLGWFEITPKTKFYFTDPAWQTWGFFDSEVETLREELTNSDAESCGVFKIDFSQKNDVIAEQFRIWIEQRRSEVIQRLNKFKPCGKKVVACGRGHKKRKCEDFLKALGGLRALKYWGSSEEAETLTENLYTDEHSWKRAEFQAGEMFTRLAVAWKYVASPFDPFANFDTHSIFPPQQLRQPLSGTVPIPKKHLAEIEKIVAEDFVVSALKTELI